MTTILDYGIGNLRSLAKAFAAAGVAAERVSDPDRAARAERLVVPGVGAFGACADALRAHGLWDVVLDRAAAGVPVLGVCVGMQLLFEASEERPAADGREHAGLGLLPGRVVRFRDGLRGADGGRLKVPHMGWNRVEAVREHAVSPDRSDGGPEPWAYFVHSYHAVPADPDTVLAIADYGGPVPAVVGRANVVGAQFHPEKSGPTGLAMLRRFAAWTPSPGGQDFRGQGDRSPATLGGPSERSLSEPLPPAPRTPAA